MLYVIVTHIPQKGDRSGCFLHLGQGKFTSEPALLSPLLMKLVGRDALLVLDLALYHVDGVDQLHLEDDHPRGGHPRGTKILDEDLHLAFCRSEVCSRPRVSGRLRDALCLSLCLRPRRTYNAVCIGLRISGDLLCPPGTLCVRVCCCCCVLYVCVLYICVLFMSSGNPAISFVHVRPQ